VAERSTGRSMDLYDSWNWRDKWPSRLLLWLLIVIQVVLAFTPWSVIAVLYMMSWRAEAAIGRWPRPWVDDPKFIVHNDQFYDYLYDLPITVFSIACVSGILLPALTFALHGIFKLPRIWSISLLVFYTLGLVFFMMDPGQRLKWYLD
jgi:hypothetical protein